MTDGVNTEFMKINGKIVIIVKGKHGTWKRVIVLGRDAEESEGKMEWTDLPSAELARLKLRIGGTITGTVGFAGLGAQSEKGEIELARNGGFGFDEEQLRELVQRELVQLGVEVENYVPRIDGPIEMSDVEILPMLEQEYPADMPLPDVAKFRIRIRGKIKIGIKFSTLGEAELAVSQKTGSVWIRDNRGESMRVVGARFDAEKLDEVEIEDVKVAPIGKLAAAAESLADIEIIHVDGVIRYGNQQNVAEQKNNDDEKMEEEELDLANLSSSDLTQLRIKIRGKIKIGIKFSSFSSMKEVESQSGEGLVWVRTENSGKMDDVRVGGTIALDKQELNELVAEQLDAFGVNVRNVIDLMRVAEPVEMSDIEILSSPEGSETDSADPSSDITPFRFRIRIRGKIKITIKFSNSLVSEEDEPPSGGGEGSVWVRENAVGSIRTGVSDVEELSKIEIEDIGVVPDAELA